MTIQPESNFELRKCVARVLARKPDACRSAVHDIA